MCNKILISIFALISSTFAATLCDNSTTLKFAIDSQNRQVLACVLKRKPDLNAIVVGNPINGSKTALEYAIEKSDKAMVVVDMLYNAGATLPFKGNFIEFCQNPNISTKDIENILKQGVDINEKDSDGRTALHVVAANNPNPQVINFFIKKGANINAIDNSNRSVLQAAKENSNPAIATILRKAGATIPFDGNIINLCVNKDVSVNDLENAIKQGADVNESDNEGWTSLHALAQYSRDPKTIVFLIKKGAFVNATTKSGISPLLIAARHNPNPAFVKILIAAKAEKEIMDPDGWTPLMNAIAYNKAEVIITLLQQKVAINNENRLFRIALRNNEDETVIATLLKNGFKAEPDPLLPRPLHTAIEYNKNPLIIKILLTAGAKVDDKALDLAQNLPMDTAKERIFRNNILDQLQKATRK